MKRNHLVILKKQYLDAILAGTKTIESRLLKTKHPPVGQISVGDKLFLKQSSGPVCATATVKAVKTYEDLTPESLEKILDAFARGETPPPGPQNGRHGSEPEGGALTLRDLPFNAAGPAGTALAEGQDAAVRRMARLERRLARQD